MSCKITKIENRYRKSNPELADRLNQLTLDTWNKVIDSNLFERKDDELYADQLGTDNRVKQDELIDSINSPTSKKGADFVFEFNSELSLIGNHQQYSRYLDTIFPDSKVKDIVYHGSPNGKKILKNTDFRFKFIDEEMSNIELNGVYFSQNKDTADSYSNGVYTYTDKTNKAVLPSLLNVKNPKYTRSIDDVSLISNKEFEKLKNDGNDALYTDMESDDYLRSHKKDYITEIAVFEPEQIHILSSKSDIQGFKDFMVFENSEFSRYGTYQQFRDFINNKSSIEIENKLIETGKIDRVC